METLAALAGILLRDVEPTRFLHGQGVLLADLDGASRTSPSDAGGAHTQLAAGLARRMLGSRLELDLPPNTARELAETLASPPDLPGLVRALERAALHVVRR